MNMEFHTLSILRLLLLLGAVVTVSGCGILANLEQAGSKPVPLSEVIQSLEADLSRTHPVILSDIQVPLTIGSEERPEVTAMLTAIANIQCYDIDPVTKSPDPHLRKRDPLIPVVTGPVQLTVQGQISTAGTITVSVPASIGSTVTRQAQQQIMLPTTLVPLINLPVFYLGQQMTNIQFAPLANTTTYNIDKARLDAENSQVATYVSRSLDVMSALTTIVTYSLRQFDADQNGYCGGRDGGKGPPVIVVVPAL